MQCAISIILLPLLLGLALACGTTSAEQISPPPSAIAYEEDGYRIWLEAPEETPLGEPVTLKLYVENITDGPLRITTDYYKYDFFVTPPHVQIEYGRLSTGAVIWGFRTFLFTPDMANYIDLEPGEFKVFEEEWDQRETVWDQELGDVGQQVPPGDYLIIGAIARGGYQEYQFTEPQTITLKQP